MRLLVASLMDDYRALEARVLSLDREIERLARTNEVANRLTTIPGVGPLGATALIAAVGDCRQFKRARDLARWLGAGRPSSRRLTRAHRQRGGEPRSGSASTNGPNVVSSRRSRWPLRWPLQPGPRSYRPRPRAASSSSSRSCSMNARTWPRTASPKDRTSRRPDSSVASPAGVALSMAWVLPSKAFEPTPQIHLTFSMDRRLNFSTPLTNISTARTVAVSAHGCGSAPSQTINY